MLTLVLVQLGRQGDLCKTERWKLISRFLCFGDLSECCVSLLSGKERWRLSKRTEAGIPGLHSRLAKPCAGRSFHLSATWFLPL